MFPLINSPSPPPLFWTDLSKEEQKKVSTKARSPIVADRTLGNHHKNSSKDKDAAIESLAKLDITPPASQKLITFQELDVSL